MELNLENLKKLKRAKRIAIIKKDPLVIELIEQLKIELLNRQTTWDYSEPNSDTRKNATRIENLLKKFV